MLDVDAVRAVTRLIDKGFEAYLVGGCVRDLLLDRTPKDYDIATEARPPQVKRTFPRNCRIIGRRFKLAHLHFHGNTKILECSTFRRTPQERPEGEGDDADLLITRDNEFGTAEEDALRRDFTVNALFLDPTRDLIVDHCNGLEDIEARVIRTIGDPVVRFREDPVRILRAAKFAGRLGFSVEKKTLAAMGETAEDLVRAAPPRVLEEILRLMRSGHAHSSFELLRDVGAIEHLIPVVGKFLQNATAEQGATFWKLLDALDQRVQSRPSDSEPPPNGVLLAVLMYGAVEAERERRPTRSASSVAESLLGSLAIDLRLPRRDSGCLKRICGVQHRFEQPEDKRRFRTESFVHSPYFEEALQLFALRTAAAGKDRDVVDHWYDTAGTHPLVDEETTTEAADERDADAREDQPRKTRRRRRRRRPGEEDEAMSTDEQDPTAEHDEDAEVRSADPVEAAPEPEDEHAVRDVPQRKAKAKRAKKAKVKPRKKAAAAEEDLSDVTFPSSDEPSPHGDPFQDRTTRTQPTTADRDAAFPVDHGNEDRGRTDAHRDDARRDDAGRDDADRRDPDGSVAVGDQSDARRARPRRRRGRRDRGEEDRDRPREDHDIGGDREDRDDRHEEPRDTTTGEDDREPTTGDDSEDREARGAKRRRRGRRGRGKSRGGDDQRQDDGEVAVAPANRGEPTSGRSRNKVKTKKAGEPRREAKKRGQKGDGRRDTKRSHKGKSGGNRDVDVVPRYRDRRGKVEVIEPVSLDLSAFDVELDPKRVPTFGSIVEGKGRPKRRGPRPPEQDQDSYRPPPPPGGKDRPDAPPPAPPADGPDTFGDW